MTEPFIPEPILLDKSNAFVVADANFTTLTNDVDFALPTVNFSSPQFQLPSRTGNTLYSDIAKLTVSDLTTRSIDGSGVFDQLMVANKVHIAEEFDKGRLTAEQYSKAYIEITTAVMNMSLQFVLQKEQNYWSNILLQSQARQAEIQAVTAATQLEINKAELVMKQYDTKTSEANYAVSKMRLATENAQFTNITAQINSTLFQLEELMPKQKELLNEQVEVQHAQTSDLKLDGVTPVTGSVGKQRELYTQQITSYKRDSEYKTAKMFLDAWITQKTLDDGLNAPAQLTNLNIDSVIASVRSNNNL